MIGALYTFHQHHLHGVSDQVHEDFVYHPLDGCPCVLESEGHHLVAVDSSISNEGHLVFIWRVHLDLIILGIGIHETKELIARRRLYLLIDPWKG